MGDRWSCAHGDTGPQVMPGLVHTPTRLSEGTERRRGSTVKKLNFMFHKVWV